MSDKICTFKLSEETKKKIEKIAEDSDRSFSAQIRVILESYIEKR